MISHIPDALQRMKIPDLTEFIGMSLREAERGLEAIKSHELELDATYANTHRFPSPTWAVPTFIESANGKGMTYTPYRGDKLVRQAVAQNIQSSFGITTQGDTDVILTPGTQAALFEAIFALVSPGDTVMVPDPDYLTTERILKYLGANVIRIPMVWEHENNSAICELLSEIPNIIVTDAIIPDVSKVETSVPSILPEPSPVIIPQTTVALPPVVTKPTSPPLHNQKSYNTFKDPFAGTSWGNNAKRTK